MRISFSVAVERMFDGSIDWNHRKVHPSRTSRAYCDSPSDAMQKLKDGATALIAYEDIPAFEKLVLEEQKRQGVFDWTPELWD